MDARTVPYAPRGLPRRPNIPWSAFLWAGLALAVSVVLGMAAAARPVAAVALVAVTGATSLVLLRSQRRMLVLVLLVIAIFTEGIDVAGVSVDRLVSPIGLVAIIFALVAGLRFPIGPPLQWVLLYVLWAIASGFWTADVGRTVTVLFSLGTALVFMVAFAIFVDRRAVLDRVLQAIAATALVVGVIGALAFFNGGETRSRGTVGDYNFFAAYELFALPLVLVLFAAARKRSVQAWLLAAVVTILAAILATLSRGGVLSLLAVIGLIIVMPARQLFSNASQKTALLVITAIAAVTLATVPQQKVLPRLTSVFSQKDKGSGRVNAWLAAKTTIKERPVLGLGYGGFLPASNDLMRRTPGVDLIDFDLRQRGLEPHNAYIGTTAELGFVGLVFFVGILLSTAWTFRRCAKRAREVGAVFLMRICNALILSLIGWCIASLFLSSETNKPLWVMIGFALAMPGLIEDAARGGRSREEEVET